MRATFGFINLFRAIAAFWVLAAHCMIWGGWYAWLPSATMAVDLFMIVSGYLMAANADSRSATEPLTEIGNWSRFWLRRFFRIAPAYYFSLALAVSITEFYLGGFKELQLLAPERWAGGVVYDPDRIEYDPTNIMLHLSFVFGLHPSYSFSTFLPDWTLSLEMQFYWVFPALLLGMRRFGMVGVAIVLGVSAYYLSAWIRSHVHFYEPSLLLFKLPDFLAGILLYRALRPEKSIIKRGAAAFGAVALISLWFIHGNREHLVLLFMLLAMLGLGYLETANKLPPRLSAIVRGRIVRFASDSSYAVYLFHGFFISACGQIISAWTPLQDLAPALRVALIFIFVFPLSHALAILIRRYVELPGIRLGEWIIDRQPTQLLVAAK